MVHAFRTDRTYQQQFTDVWRWMDWPGRSGADIGVDLVARDADGYVLGSRSAIAWVIVSNRVKTDKASGIVNDPNDWAIEHDDPTYILDLVGRVVTVSMRTLDIVDSLPALDL